MSKVESLPVFICDAGGDFLALVGGEWGFTPDQARAYIFDYHADEVAAQLRQAYRDFGIAWFVIPVDPQLAGERCDDCHRVVYSLEAHFDGGRFRCPACASRFDHALSP
jgi:hypothetical protein